jgi:hypothetical protein
VAALSAAALVAIAAAVVLSRGPDRPVAHASAGAAVHAAIRRSTPTATPEVGLAPANDDFDAARQVRVGVEYAGSMAGATAELGEPRHAGVRAAHSLWFRFRAARDAPMTVDSGGSHTGNRLAAYVGSDLAHLRPIAEAAENSPTGAGAVIRFTAARGRIYRIALDGDAPDAYRLWVSDGGVKGKGLELVVDPGQTVASVRAGGLRTQVRARRAVEVDLALRVGRTLERRLGLDSPVLGGVRGRVDYGQQLTATIRLKRTVRRALRARSQLRARLRLTILASAAPHRVLVHPVVLGG